MSMIEDDDDYDEDIGDFEDDSPPKAALKRQQTEEVDDYEDDFGGAADGAPADEPASARPRRNAVKTPSKRRRNAK